MNSLQTQITWCRRLQWGLNLGLGVAVLVFFFGGYRPAQARLDGLQMQIRSKTRDLEDHQNKARNLPLLAMEVQELEAKVQDYDRQFPRQVDLGEFIRDISKVSQQLTLRDWKYQPGAPRRGDAYFELPIQMNFQSEFLNVCSFLYEIERLQRLTRVHKLVVKNKDPKTGLVEVEVVLRIFFSEG